jgi:hypothetical protein
LIEFIKLIKLIELIADSREAGRLGCYDPGKVGSYEGEKVAGKAHSE